MSTGETGVGDVFRLAGATLDGRFHIDGPIAEGGFGVVYRAQQTALERPVALKVLKTPPELSEHAREQFLHVFATEAKTIARITHPNIVQVHDFGVSLMPSGEEAPWMALEWLTGLTLEEELLRRRGGGGRSPGECLTLMRPVLSALATVHAAGVAHRDLKPANIMLVEAAGGRVPKLLDFGIAKIMESDEAPGSGHTATRSRQIAFSPAYASPEQVGHGRSGPWTDVHALSLLITEVLTDEPPIAGEDTTTMFQSILDRERPTPRRFGVEVGPWEAILHRAAAIAPAERYKDAGELLRALVDAEPEASLRHSLSVGAKTAGPAEPLLPVARKPEVAHARVALEPTTRSPRPRPRWVAPVAGVSALLVLGAAALVARGPATHSTPIAASMAMSTLPAEAEAPPSPLTEAAEPKPIPPASPVASASAAHVRSRSPPRSNGAPKPVASVSHVNCDPPFSVDALGKKHYKLECNN